MWRFSYSLVFILLAVACSPTKPTEPSQRISLGDERGRYTFDTPDTTWDMFSLGGDQALFRVQGGVLEGAVIADRGYIWSLSNTRHNDVAISAVVGQTKGSRGNGFGVMCRANEQGDGYYFVVSSAGQFAILKAQTGVSDPLRLVDWQSSPAIFPGDESNEIEAICADDYLSFSANSTFLADVRDTEFSSGELGVVLGAIEETLWVSFDDIIVHEAAQAGG
jgi:hypothetical protein